MTIVRLAHVAGAQGDNTLIGRKGVDQLPRDSAPSLLVSYYYLPGFLKVRSQSRYRYWALDSGAFSAMNGGKDISLDRFIDAARALVSDDPTLVEVFALDVIGDHRASRRNVERMWSVGIRATPCYHAGSPWDELVSLARTYPKIGIGGVARKKKAEKVAFARACFARLWQEVGPTRVHGFGFGARDYLLIAPFHSVDATNWEVGPCKFGQWESFGALSVRGGDQDLRVEVERHLRYEREARARWGSELARI